MKARIILPITFTLTLLSCSSDYVIPPQAPTAQLYYEDGPTLQIFAHLFKDSETCKDPHILPGYQYSKRLDKSRIGPYPIEASISTTINVRGIDSQSLWRGEVCNPTFTTIFQPNHSYLIKMVERGDKCNALVYDITENPRIDASALEPVKVRYRKYNASLYAKSVCED